MERSFELQNNCGDLVTGSETHARMLLRWVTTGLLIQFLNKGSQCASSYTLEKPDDKFFSRFNSYKLDRKNGYNDFQYPKEDTTHGVGYGHYLHPFYYQGNPPLYSCAIQGEWHPIVQHEHHSNSIQNYDRSDAAENFKPVYNNPTPYKPENHIKHFLDDKLRRADIFHTSLDSMTNDVNNKKDTIKYYSGDADGHQEYTSYAKPNETEVSATNEEGIPTYLTPPPPPPLAPILDMVLQQLLPSKRHYNLRNEQKLVDILTTLHIIPHSEDLDFF
ncbi:uncharacterized protein [Periplaneta americana]|uniref:uncharacterized protein n=1 Tax=Periplaneta americana TaxID=6978 RepID=UPI0037E9599A